MKARLVAVIGATLLATACGSDTAVPDTIRISAVNPKPDLVQISTPTEAEGEGQCDTEATLRPGPLPRPGAMPPGSSLNSIVANGRLRVGVDQNTYLFGFRNPATGELEGFDIDIAKEIAKAIFGDPNKIELRSVTAAERIPNLRNNTVDLVVRSFSATCERRKEVDFSAVYYRAAQRILAPKDAGIASGADLAEKVVCVTRGTTAPGMLLGLPNPPTIMGAANWTDCLAALQQGHVDALSGDHPIMVGLVQQDQNLAIVGDPIGSGSYAVGVAKGNPDLVRFVNGVLEQMRVDGTWQRLYHASLSALGPAEPPAPRYVE